MSILRGGLLLGFGVAWSCAAPPGEPTLDLKVSPSQMPRGQEVRVLVTATAGDGKIGTGTVHISSDEGSLVDGVDVELDRYGSASAPFTCAGACNGPFRLSARWGSVTATNNVEVAAGPGPIVVCEVGTVTSAATQGTLDLFGAVLYFDNGAPLPAGNYRIKNSGGCMKYGPGQNWTVHAFPNGAIAWWLVGETTSDKLFMPPGTFLLDASGNNIGFADYAACDAANRALPARSFTFAGGKLGIWLDDAIYMDNTSGTGSNPSWTLTKVVSGCP